MSYQSCLDEVRKAAPELSEARIGEMFERFFAERERLIQEGQSAADASAAAVRNLSQRPKGVMFRAVAAAVEMSGDSKALREYFGLDKPAFEMVQRIRSNAEEIVDRVIETLSDARLADEMVAHPGHTDALFHQAADVLDRARALLDPTGNALLPETGAYIRVAETYADAWHAVASCARRL